jgi:hypothetical protein
MTKHSQMKPLTTTEKTISSGLTFHQETIHFNDRFTNLYWLKLDTNKYKFCLKKYPQPKPLVDYQLKDKKNYGRYQLC